MGDETRATGGGRPAHASVPGYIHGLCRDLRREETPTESVLWEALRGRRLEGAKFRRQHPLGRYVADFYCAEARLVIEVDGAVHGREAQAEYDDVRERELNARGLRVLRFTADAVERGLEHVLVRIAEVLREQALSVRHPDL